MKHTPDLNKKFDNTIKQGLINYYKNKSMYHNEIDLQTLRIQIENFNWNGASYRVDIFHNKRLSFIPYDSNFSWAHRMWISTSGGIVKSEPVYEISNPESELEGKKISKKNTGFFPGNSHYQQELNFIDQALKNAGAAYRLEDSSENSRSLSIDVSDGNQSLIKYRASIIENIDNYTIRLDIQQTDYQYVPPFDMLNRPEGFNGIHLFFIFDINKLDEKLKSIRFENYTPPALC